MQRTRHHSKTVIFADPVKLDADPCAIGDLSDTFGLTLRAIRFYCDRGLIKPLTPKDETRYFDQHNVDRLALIVKATSLGFTLREIQSFLTDRVSGRRGPALVIPTARLDEAIALLQDRRERMLHQIEQLIAYSGTRPLVRGSTQAGQTGAAA